MSTIHFNAEHNEEARRIAHEAIDKLIDAAKAQNDHVQINLQRSMRDVTEPGDQYVKYAVGHGRKLLIEIAAREGESYT